MTFLFWASVSSSVTRMGVGWVEVMSGHKIRHLRCMCETHTLSVHYVLSTAHRYTISTWIHNKLLPAIKSSAQYLDM